MHPWIFVRSALDPAFSSDADICLVLWRTDKSILLLPDNLTLHQGIKLILKLFRENELWIMSVKGTDRRVRSRMMVNMIGLFMSLFCASSHGDNDNYGLLSFHRLTHCISGSMITMWPPPLFPDVLLASSSDGNCPQRGGRPFGFHFFSFFAASSDIQYIALKDNHALFLAQK